MYKPSKRGNQGGGGTAGAGDRPGGEDSEECFDYPWGCACAIDWNLKESVRARMKVAVKRLLRQYGYPPDMEDLATELVLEQAKVFTQHQVSNS